MNPDIDTWHTVRCGTLLLEWDKCQVCYVCLVLCANETHSDLPVGSGWFQGCNDRQSDQLPWVCHRTLCSHLGHTAEICQKVNLELLSGCWSRYGQKAAAPAVWLAEQLINSLQPLWRSIFAVDLLLSLKQVTFQSFFLFFSSPGDECALRINRCTVALPPTCISDSRLQTASSDLTPCKTFPARSPRIPCRLQALHSHHLSGT